MLRVNVWRHPELSGDFAVAPDSTLVHPLYQTVKVAGAPLTVVRARLLGLLAPYEQGVDFVLEPLFAVTVAGGARPTSPPHRPPGRARTPRQPWGGGRPGPGARPQGR